MYISLFMKRHGTVYNSYNRQWNTKPLSTDILFTNKTASAEGGSEALEDETERVIDLIHGMRLTSTLFDKKQYKEYLKDYVQSIKKRLQEKDPERADLFAKNAAPYMKKVMDNFDDYDCYISEHWNGTGWVVLMNFREDGVTPYFVFLKDGLKEDKY